MSSQGQIGFTELDADLPFLTKADQRNYARAFLDAGHVHGYLAGDRSRTLFLKSGLSSDSLSRIWDLSDIDGNGYLTFSEFAVALFLTNSKRRGVEVPLHLPENIYRQLRKNVCSDYRSLWSIKEPERDTYRKLFQTHRDTAIQETGGEDTSSPFGSSGNSYLGRHEADRVFTKSGLSLHTIDSIWRLADVDHNGRLDEEEFCVAMALISRHLAGEPLWEKLPEELFPPSHRAFIQEDMMLDRRRWRKSLEESSSNVVRSPIMLDSTRRQQEVSTSTTDISPVKSSLLQSKLEMLRANLGQSERRVKEKLQEQERNQLELYNYSSKRSLKPSVETSPSIKEKELSQWKYDLEQLKRKLTDSKSLMEETCEDANDALIATIEDPEVIKLRKEIEHYDDESQCLGLSETEKITKKGASLLAKRMAELKLADWEKSHPSPPKEAHRSTRSKTYDNQRQQNLIVERLDEFSKGITDLEGVLGELSNAGVGHDENSYSPKPTSIISPSLQKSQKTSPTLLSSPKTTVAETATQSPYMTKGQKPDSYQSPKKFNEPSSITSESPVDQKAILSTSPIRSEKKFQDHSPRTTSESDSSKSFPTDEGYKGRATFSGSLVAHLKDRFKTMDRSESSLSKSQSSSSIPSLERHDDESPETQFRGNVNLSLESVNDFKLSEVSIGMTTPSQVKQSESKSSLTTPNTSPLSSGQGCVALYDFTGRTEEELSFYTGDHLVVHEKLDENWYHGELNGRYGLVPVTYVTWDNESNQQDAHQDRETISDSESYDYQSSEANSRHLRKDSSLTEDNEDLMGSKSFEGSREDLQPYRDELQVEYQIEPMTVQSLKWTNIIGEDRAKFFAQQERIRQEAIFELILTERVYVRDLQILMEVFIYPLRHLISTTETELIFSSIEDIVYGNSLLLSELETRQIEQDYVIDCLGDILLRHKDNLTPYIRYCGEQKQFTQYLQGKISKDRTLAEFLEKCRRNESCRNLDIFSFLLMPMQRITRYPLLLKQILHYTPKNHDDHRTLLLALTSIENLAEQSNEAARQNENVMKLRELRQQIDLSSLRDELDLTQTTRELGARVFLFEGEVSKLRSGKRLHAFLFNDIFLLTTTRTSTRPPSFVLYGKPMKLKEALNATSHTDPASPTEDVAFEVFNESESILLRAPSAFFKKKWLEMLQGAISKACLSDSSALSQSDASSIVTLSNFVGTLMVRIIEANHLLPRRKGGKCCAFCLLRLGRQKARTHIIPNTLHPKWNEEFVFSVASLDETLRVIVLDYGEYSTDDYLGQKEIDLNLLEYYGERETEDIYLKLADVPTGEVSLSMCFKMA